jgi:hypothetical protein
MADGGQGGRDCSLNRNFINNIVLKSSYKMHGPTELRFAHLNPGSAAAHIDEMNGLFQGVGIDVICVSESWYKGWHTNKRICIPGYRVARADRKDGRRGGGVAMFIKSELKFKVLTRSPELSAIDYLFVEIKFHGRAVLVGLVYDPPRVEGLPIYLPILEDLVPRYAHSIFLGDLNTDLLGNTVRAAELKLRLDSVSLHIISREATNFAADPPTLLDICATSEPEAVKMFSQLSLPEMNTGHDMIYGSYKICEIAQNTAALPHYYRDYGRIDLEQLQSDLMVQTWDAIYDMYDPEEQLQHFNSIVLWLLDLHAPLRRFVKKDVTNPWYSFDIERAIVERNIAYRVWKRRRTVADRERYKVQRRQVNFLVREAKRQYMKKFLDPSLPSRLLWRNLDKIGAKNTTDNNILYTPDQLNDYFTSRTPAASRHTDAANPPGLDDFSFCNTYDLEVFNALHQIKSNAVGMDGVPIRFLKIILPYILPYVTHIFNTVLTTSTFPATWKISKITPLAKSNDPGALSDYRPISILPAISKALEVIIRRQIMNHVDNKGLLSRCQSGFRQNHSTATALLKITNDLLIASENKLLSVLVLLDFSKAFDSVDHDLLCYKLTNQYGFTSSATSLIRSYLSGRMQCVCVDGVNSEFLPINAGVVQGSVLGPILFSLFINDIVQRIRFSTCHMYADDVQLYISSTPSDISTCVAHINEDLDSIWRWSQENYLSINPAKSQAMLINSRSLTTAGAPTIHMGNNTIYYCEKVKNLGLIMNQHLSWEDHVARTCSSVFYTLRRLWPMAHFTPTETRRRLVVSLIVPQFLYCDVIFAKSSARLRERLKITFNACARYIYGISRFQHISEYTNKILGMPLDIYYDWRICCMMHRLIEGRGPEYLSDLLQFGRSTRLRILITPAHRSSARASSFFVQGAILWNGLPVSVRGVERGFREVCKSYLLRSVEGNNA